MTYLKDINFLYKICSAAYEKIYIKTIILDLNEIPVDSIEGIVLDGSINIDGTSAIQRSCSLSFLLTEKQKESPNWGLGSMFQLYIGVENTTQEYTDYSIIYFPMGIFYLTNYSVSKSSRGNTVSIQGKDKMCKLNGEIGGIFNSDIDFGSIDLVDLINNVITKESISIKTILFELLHHYANEPYHKIIINDIDDYGLNLITYRDDKPLYYFVELRKNEQDEIFPYITNCYYGKFIYEEETEETNEEEEEGKNDFISFSVLKEVLNNNKYGNQDDFSDFSADNDKKINKYAYYIYDKGTFKYLKKSFSTENTVAEIYYTLNIDENTEEEKNNKGFFICKNDYGDIIGYELTKLIYPNELIANAGTTIIAILDKVKQMLGNYIYYYDEMGNFVFKKKNELVKENQPLNIFFSAKKPNYFLSDYLADSINSSFNIMNIKNDFTVWGQQKLADGVVKDIHVRYAIDDKPIEYTKIKITNERAKMLVEKYPERFYIDKTISKNTAIDNLVQNNETYSADKDDWREIIYQMALDYNKFNQTDEYILWLQESNPRYVSGKTGYERYYTDLLGFWRTLYQPPMDIGPVPQLKTLKTDKNITYDIATIEDDMIFFCTSKGIEVGVNHSLDSFANLLTTEANLLTTEQAIKNQLKEYIKLFEQKNKIKIRNEFSEEDIAKILEKSNIDDQTVAIHGVFQKAVKKYFKIQNDPTFWDLFFYNDDRFWPHELENKDYYKNIKWDIESDSFPNIKLYQKKIDKKLQQETYEEIGYLNDIIKNNYKILSYMYYIVNPWNFWHSGRYLIAEDLTTHNRTKYHMSYLARMLCQNLLPEEYSDKGKSYLNKIWSCVQEDNKIELLGIFYDIKSLYYNSADYFGNMEFFNKDSSNLNDNDNFLNSVKNDFETNPIYLQMKNYPTNKNGESLCNITDMDDDKMAFVLYAQANGILFERDSNYDDNGWNKNINNAPEKLDFWFDFLTSDKINSNYTVQNIGPREVVKKDQSVNCISSLAIPEIILINPKNKISDTPEKQIKILQSFYKKARPETSFLHLNVDLANSFTNTNTIKSAMDVIVDLLYQHVFSINTVSISCIPQYYMQPDVLLGFFDINNSISKEYHIDKLSFNFNANNLMTISGTEYINNILDYYLNSNMITTSV